MYVCVAFVAHGYEVLFRMAAASAACDDVVQLQAIVARRAAQDASFLIAIEHCAAHRVRNREPMLVGFMRFSHTALSGSVPMARGARCRRRGECHAYATVEARGRCLFFGLVVIPVACIQQPVALTIAHGARSPDPTWCRTGGS